MKDFLGIGATAKAVVGLGKTAIIFTCFVILSIAGLIQYGFRKLVNSDMFYPKYEIYICTKYDENFAPAGVTAYDENRVGLKVRYNEYQNKIFYWDNMTQNMKEEFLDLGGEPNQ